MSQDQRPGKVKTYSGNGSKPGGVRAVRGASGAIPQRRSGDALAGGAAALPGPGEEAAGGSGAGWIAVLLFILGSAIGAGLFIVFAPR